jgi:hypothetical protein
MTGGRIGTRSGSMDGSGTCSLKGLTGLMMIGGIAGGAEGGPFGPPGTTARRMRCALIASAALANPRAS